VASCVSLQTAAAIATSAFATLGPAGTGALRFLAAALILLVAVRPRLHDRSATFWRSAAALGVTTAATNLFLYEAIARIPLGTAATLVFVGPLAVALASTRRRLDVAWAGGAAVGVVLLAGGAAAASWTGVALAMGAAASVAASILLLRGIGARAGGADGLTMAIAIAAVITLPIGINAAWGTAMLPEVPVIAVVGALGIAIPYALEFAALRRVGVKTYSILLSLDPAIAALAGLLLLGQHLDSGEYLGIALVMAASGGSVATGER
jgi:inner membrane transporter RhtA